VDKPRRTGRVLLIILLVLVLTGAAFGAWVLLSGDEAAADEVVLEAIGEPGPSPFTDPVAPQPAGSLLAFASSTADEGIEAGEEMAGYRAADGSVPGVYGGTLNEAACDPDLLVSFLGAEPQKAEVWASTLGIDVSDIPAYIASLTPVNLATDARVVNHGFVDGEAVPRQAVLQRGSAVMVDAFGVPRVDCYSGSPLREPQPLEDESFVGDAWEGFSGDRVIVVLGAPTQQEGFQLRNVENGELFTRPAGSTGESDQTGTVDLVDDGPIEFDTSYEDALIEGRSEARYLLDAPDGAIMTFKVANQRDSERRVRLEVFSEGDGYLSFRINPGATEEATIVLDHDGGAQFELMFDEGPAAYAFEVELAVQDDAGQGGDAGEEFDTAFPIAPGQPVRGLLGGQDGMDAYVVDLVPGSDLRFQATNERDSTRRARFTLRLEGDRLFTERASPGGSTETSILFGGDAGGQLAIIVDEGGADYAFQVDFVEQADGAQDGDAGNELVDGRTIPSGEELSGQVGGRDPADWYLFETPSENLELDVTVDAASERRVRFSVQDADGDSVFTTRVNPGATETVGFEAEPDQEYRLVVDEGRGSYAFSIDELEVGAGSG